MPKNNFPIKDFSRACSDKIWKQHKVFTEKTLYGSVRNSTVRRSSRVKAKLMTNNNKNNNYSQSSTESEDESQTKKHKKYQYLSSDSEFESDYEDETSSEEEEILMLWWRCGWCILFINKM